VELLQFLLILVVLLAAVAVISAPLRATREGAHDDGASEGGELERLEAAREAKYREIRDAELDFRTGKLSPEDFQRVDGQLRAEAVEILRELDRARERASESTN
jgi:hypothetical protein